MTTFSHDRNSRLSKDLPDPAASVSSVKFSPRTTTSVRNVERRENGEPRTYRPLTTCPSCDNLEKVDDGDYLCRYCRASTEGS